MSFASAMITDGMQANTTTPKDSELDFSSALDAAAAIRAKTVSSVELAERVLARIDRYNPKLNAFTYVLREQALQQAQEADRALSRGDWLGPFHGVPVCVKESFGVEGQPATWGLTVYKDSKAPAHSTAVQRLLNAGAVLMGGTNVPHMLGDWQTFNDMYGTTNNPWDLTRTPGGSSGGSAAALAAGLSYLALGSDLAGSLRVPAAFCGVYSHKPTLDLIDARGHAPGGVHGVPGFSTGLAVAGPMARSASDLAAALQVLGGPEGYDRKAWSWTLPPPRKRALKEFRVGYVMDSALAKPTSEVQAVLDRTVGALERAGVQLHPGWPQGYSLEEGLDTFLFLLGAFLFSVARKEAQDRDREQYKQRSDRFAAGALSSYADWQQQHLRRLAFRDVWQRYFEQTDVFLMPCTFTAAFPHYQEKDFDARVLDTPEGKRPYRELMPWIATPTLTGCPATVAPVGQTAGGLPVGIHIMGPFGEDAKPIEFASLLSEEIGGFRAPTGYEE